ncbi:hypothetical protein J6590_016079 [Homalodisca vitripennis]|nr:hypothetical protein J6590_016079 [Homalodisca vitripennis]
MFDSRLASEEELDLRRVLLLVNGPRCYESESAAACRTLGRIPLLSQCPAAPVTADDARWPLTGPRDKNIDAPPAELSAAARIPFLARPRNSAECMCKRPLQCCGFLALSGLMQLRGDDFFLAQAIEDLR